jgi:hypothetical protein
LPDKTFNGEFVSTPKNTFVALDRPNNAKFYMLHLTACARYADPQSGKIHFTPSGYLIFGTDGPLPLDHNPIPADKLGLRLGGQYAD